MRPTYGHDRNDSRVANKQQQNASALNSKASLANLIHFVRYPLDNVSKTVEDWFEGSTEEERARQQRAEDRKQLLYCKMRAVRNPPF